MSQPLTKPIKAMQYRIAGPAAGLRRFRQITGLHRWRLRLYLHHSSGEVDERDVLVSAPCLPLHLLTVYQQQVADLCQPIDGQPPTVSGGGFDAWILPPQPRT